MSQSVFARPSIRTRIFFEKNKLFPPQHREFGIGLPDERLDELMRELSLYAQRRAKALRESKTAEGDSKDRQQPNEDDEEPDEEFNPMTNAKQ